MAAPVVIYIASRNHNKIEEFAQMLPADVADVRGLPSGVPDCPENGASFEANAMEKAVFYASFVDGWVLADDSGLCVDALNGGPGVRSARYAGRHGDDAANNEKLLAALRGVPRAERTARYVCAIALWSASAGRGYLARGELAGEIAEQPAGSQGFGYDPLFYLPEFQQTVAEIPPRVKNRISHRKRALDAVLRLWRCAEFETLSGQ